MRSILVLPLMLAACAAGPANPGQPTVFSGEATGRIGETVRIGDVSITPREVLQDSRCPEEVMCVHAGFFRVRTEIRTGRETRTEVLDWHRGIALEDARSVTLTRVEPGRRQGSGPAPADYRLTFTLGPGD